MHKKCLDRSSPQMEPVLSDSMGNKCRGGFFSFFCKHSKNRSASSFSLLFTLYSHTITFDLSLSTKEDFNTFFFQLQSQLPARAQVWAAVGGGKEAGAGRFVLLSPQRFSKLLHFTFYLMSHLNAFKVVALFASDGSNLIGKAQVERIQDEFCLLLYRCCLFRSFTYCVFPTRTRNSFKTYFKFSGSWWIAMAKSKLLGGKTIFTRYLQASKTDEICLFFLVRGCPEQWSHTYSDCGPPP